MGRANEKRRKKGEREDRGASALVRERMLRANDKSDAMVRANGKRGAMVRERMVKEAQW